MSDNQSVTLPPAILSFDIESEMVSDWRNREATNILYAGWIEYQFDHKSNWYTKGKYEWLPAEDMPQKITARLNNFDGIIIGHNLWDFDYRLVWAQFGDLSAAVAKTCDTLTVLRSLHRGKGLKLDSLARINFDDSKTTSAERAIAFYKDPKMRNLALSYNEHDCDLVFKTWEQMVREQYIDIDAGGYQKRLYVGIAQILALTGQSPQMTAARFVKKYPAVINDINMTAA